MEELDLETLQVENFEEMLVVEGVLSDEVKNQEIFLSRSDIRTDLERDTVYNQFLPLGIFYKDSVNFERNASVSLAGDNGVTYVFAEGSPGTYTSLESFALQPGVGYELQVVTQDGQAYRSSQLVLPGKASLDAVYAEKGENQLGSQGIQIYVDSSPFSNTSPAYRYTYEETYKIIAPEWHPEEFVLTNYDPCALPAPTYTLEIKPKEVQNRVCYNTVASNSIIQPSSLNQLSSSLRRFPIRFINRDNFIISHRYSILVKQMVQTPDAFSFYERLNRFSDVETVFSQVQTGALRSNVYNTADEGEIVLGYVEAVSVSEKRLFFNYTDFYPGEPLPPYPFNCGYHSSPESHVSYCFEGMSFNNCPQSIIERVNLGTISYIGNNDANIGTCPGPYIYVARLCGDCTLLGSNTEPEFWIEE